MFDVINEVHPNEILRCEVGSTLHGIGIGSDDRDLMGIMLEPENAIFGTESFEQIVRRTAEEGERSGPDDIDITIYGLKKWMRLALQGNPSVIVLLYAPEKFYDLLSGEGRELIELRGSIVSQRCIGRFLGYLNGQRQRALSDSNQEKPANIRKGRKEKWASHMVRLGYQGLEMAEWGELTLPMDKSVAETCKAVKRGEIPFNDALGIAERLEKQILDLKDRDKLALPKEPNIDTVHEWMKKTYLSKLG